MTPYEVIDGIQSALQTLTAYSTVQQCLAIGVGDLKGSIIGDFSSIETTRQYALDEDNFTLGLIKAENVEYEPIDKDGETGNDYGRYCHRA